MARAEAETRRRDAIDQAVEGRGGPAPVNVDRWERIGSIVLGSGLALAALGRHPIRTLLLGFVGYRLIHRGTSGHCSVYQALGISSVHRHPALGVPAEQGDRLEKWVLIDRPVDEVYHAWENIENLPSIMTHLVSVKSIDDRRSRWTAKGPLGTTVEWEAVIIRRDENRMISWRSVEGSQVDSAGSVHFEPIEDGRKTLLRVNLKYNPPAGKVGAAIADFLGQGLDKMLQEDLARFKEKMESGQPIGIEALAGGRNGGTTIF